MPLVRIDAINSDPARLTAIGEAVHCALVDAIGIPEDDVFQVLQSHERGLLRYDSDYLGVHRDDGIVFVHVTLRRGRSDEMKRAYYNALATGLAAVGVEPRNVVAVLAENDLGDWSFGNGVPQYLDNPPAPAPAGN
jgi:hypothetical protein